MPDSIFLIGADHQLIEAPEAPTGLEKELQALLADHIDLLPGAQIDPSEPRRWQLIKREAGIPAEEGGGDLFAVDHLVVDQEAVPTLVEVKRKVDARIRREVVAQMLDYAANATLYWQAEKLRAWYDAGDPEAGAARLATWLGRADEPAEEVATEFWDKVEANLRDGQVRCIFVADEIPPSLQRLVEFLNERLLRVDVLAVEVRQYAAAGNGMRAIVPRVIGATAAAQAVKTRAPRAVRPVRWSPEEVVDNIRKRLPDAVWVAERVVAWAKGIDGMALHGGRGAAYPAFTCVYDTHQEKFRERAILMVQGGPDDFAQLELRLRRLRRNPAYRGAEARKHLEALVRATGVPRIVQGYEQRQPRPNIPLAEITEEQLARVLALCDDWCATIRAQPPEATTEDDELDEGGDE
ncbi:MAG: hypothetical protein JOZ46_01350 [Candidatus Dormibacteraeota bacterium]|nr:hypothetical protein [Candidatus Dormibacteraeota bacterium]MBV9524440.1 hypothetical protein [Candidatus Dormibacteraeota bacterium]